MNDTADRCSQSNFNIPNTPVDSLPKGTTVESIVCLTKSY